MKRPPMMVLLSGLACAALAGCGAPKAAISASASSTLRQQVAAVRAAAANHDLAAAQARLATLRTTVTGLEGQGQITSGRAAVILASVAEVDAQLGSATTTSSTSTSTTESTAPQDGGDKGNGDGKQHGKP